MAGRGDRSTRARRPLPPGFGTIWTTVAIDLVGFGIVLPILPRYAEELQASPGVIGLVVASFSALLEPPPPDSERHACHRPATGLAPAR